MSEHYASLKSVAKTLYRKGKSATLAKMTYTEWANRPVSLSIVLIARRILVVQYRDVPLGTGTRRNVLKVGVWREGRVRQGRGGKGKGKDKGPKTQGFDPGLETTQLGWKAGVCCRQLRRRSEGHVVAGGLVSATAQLMESSPTRLLRRT